MKGEPGKAPAFQFYIKDWLSDPQLRLAKPSTRGIWIDLLCFMWASNKKGILQLDEDKIMRLTGANETEVNLFFKEAQEFNFCDISVTHNGLSQICNRRMLREEKARENNRLRQRKHRENKACNTDVIHQKGGAPSPTPTPTPNAVIKKKQKTDAFSVPNSEYLKEGSEKKIMDDIDMVCEQLKESKIFPLALKFKNTMLKENKNVRAILHTLSRCYLKKQFNGGPWAYCKKIIEVENGNYNESDYKKTAP